MPGGPATGPVVGDVERRRIRVTGTVQGVGFRPFVYRLAAELGLAGQVANDSLGVLIEAEGIAGDLDALERRLRSDHPPAAVVAGVEVSPQAPTGATSFSIVESRTLSAPASAVSVDLATCVECLREMRDPADRRFGYPFVNCTNCGPRYTIIRAIPYDRANTTMAAFTMCADCRREYEDPADRRFHAEPVACPACGPRAVLMSPVGEVMASSAQAMGEAAIMLSRGCILAVKGLGGYHLATDATDDVAVAELRRRKARDDKPFAVMVTDLAAAGQLAHLTAEAEESLSSPRRPIVLVPKRAETSMASGLAPGLPELGLMLAYTPLHHLLLEQVGRPLVMTSGNLSDEPIAHDDSDALARLGPLVDAMLTHDRAIHIRCDDSVLRAGAPGAGGARRAGRPVQLLRRSRGFAPEPLALTGPARRQVLAVGAELKSTVSVVKGISLVTSHHIGDLEHLAAYRSFLQAVDHLCHLAGVTPDVVAHDLHPEYLSTKFADELDLPTVGVQHHHAHIASCLVDHLRDDRVLGVAFDGTGLGDDGTLWGGEFLVADLDGYRRVGHLLPLTLPGGVAAIREPWRMALAWAHQAVGREAAERYGSVVDERWRAVLDLVERSTGPAGPRSAGVERDRMPPAAAGAEELRRGYSPVTTSAGRLFDAVAALLGIRPRITYEAQAAIELEAAAAGEPLIAASPWDLDGLNLAGEHTHSGMAQLDPSPLVARVIAERDRGTSVGATSAGFHDAFGRATATVAADLANAQGLSVVALSGGVFQNARLTAVVERALEEAGLEVLVHHRVPPNDGGVSVGQAAVAARTRS